MSEQDDERERRAFALLERMLALPEEERQAFLERETADDATLRDRLTSLAGAASRVDDRLMTGGAMDDNPPDELPESIGAYRIVELLGQGGMGAVFRAEREAGDFDHEVAIKLVRPGALSPALIERFQRERQILAQLAHPNIARLFDGGTTDEGEPFIVMEYIEGVPLAKWAEQQDLGLEERVALFEQVCGAVRFAHQNLVIHRDLTPSNVLVTHEGTPKLIDFGIAKPTEMEESEGTTKGSLSGLTLTPGFAAPERISGAPATTLTDIYSLGKLFDILTEPEKDDADIRAIIERAAADDPDDRYSSADALIDDLERYQDGRPVAARKGGRSYTIGKFLTRYKFPVAAVATILLLLIGGLTASAIGFQRAQVARADAETRFGEVREMANTLLFDIYDAVNAVPGTTAAREMLATTAQQYLDALAADPDAPFDVRLEAGRGYTRLANVMGGVGGGNLGLREEAMANYAQADEILTALHEEQPQNRNVALALADLRYQRSIAMVHIEEDMDRGLVLARSIGPILDRGCPDGDDCALRRAQADLAEGQNHFWLEDFDEAIAAFDRTIELVGGMGTEAGRAEDAIRLMAQAYRLKGDARYYSADDAAGSVREYDVARRQLGDAIERGIDSPDMQRDLAILEWTRGGSLSEVERHDEAIAALNRSYRIMQELVDADPEDEGSLRLLAVVGGQRGLTYATAGRYAEAVPAAMASLAIRRQLSRQQPDQSGFFRDVAIQLEGLANIHGQAGNRAEACRYYRETVAQFDALDERWEMTEFDRNDTYARASEALRSC